MNKKKKRRILVLLLVIGVLISLNLAPNSREHLLSVIIHIREFGIWGALIFGLIYVLGTVAFLPGSLLTLSAGFIYGPYWAGLLVLLSSVTGAMISFLLSRTFLKSWVEEVSQASSIFLAINQAIEKKGWPVVFLLRLTPLVPFSLLNYLLGATRVRFREYCIATSIGMLPGVILYCYLGSLLSSLGDIGNSSSTSIEQRYAFWGGIIASLVVTTVLSLWAKKALKEYSPAETHNVKNAS